MECDVTGTLYLSTVADSIDVDSESQTLEVQIVDAGNGPYVNLKTDRFTFEIEEIEIISEFLHSLGQAVKTYHRKINELNKEVSGSSEGNVPTLQEQA